MEIDEKKLLESKTFCLVPWIHLHVMPDSSVIPCCTSPYDDIFGNGVEQSLQEIWNSEKFKQLRLNMLNDIPSPGCQRCYKVENLGFDSPRTSINQRFLPSLSKIKETKSDGTFHLKSNELDYIDIRFSNLCNFKCRGCSPVLSSSWYDDHQQLFNYKSSSPKVRSVSVQSPHFWEELKSLIPHAQEIYFGGGEPLITKEHFEILKLLEKMEKFEVRLSYNTNLAQLNYAQHNLADIWSKFSFVNVGISIDDQGTRAEYFRHGTKWNIIEENLRKMISDHPTVMRYVNCTVNLMNVLYLPELYTRLISTRVIDPESFHINLLLDPDEYSIQVLPLHLKNVVRKKLSSFKDDLLTQGILFQKAAKDFSNIISFMDEKDHSHLLPVFKEHTLKLDKLRNENFASTFPELKELVE